MWKEVENSEFIILEKKDYVGYAVLLQGEARGCVIERETNKVVARFFGLKTLNEACGSVEMEIKARIRAKRALERRNEKAKVLENVPENSGNGTESENSAGVPGVV
jgi:hypothetical protein